MSKHQSDKRDDQTNLILKVWSVAISDPIEVFSSFWHLMRRRTGGWWIMSEKCAFASG